MMSRANKILAVLLATQLALIAYIYRPIKTNGPPTLHFFQNIDAAEVVGLTIADPTHALTIQKKDKDWQLETAPSYPADKQKVESLVKKLLNLTSSRLVARTDTSHNRLQVAADNYNRKLTLTLKNGATRTLLLGTSPNYKTIHVRSTENDNVYLVKDLSDWEASLTPDDWWSNNYLDQDPASLTHLTLKNNHGRIALTRDDKNNWQAEGIAAGKKLADEPLQNFLNKACLIQLSSYLDRSDKAALSAKPLAELELATATATIHLEIMPGAPGKDEYVAKIDNSPFYVTVHNYEVKGLL
ncbi:MAG: DUF4340 domain-containing protein, partial [Desulfobulbaceae bacterium]|nr:DUF4340 domain-containing protein [Desulfobulbaceae bacterium]